jgi:plastocyanin
MRKTTTLLFALLMTMIQLKSSAVTVTINVEDFQFDPADITVNVGDEIQWTWDNSAGQHTTTSTTIPTGATSWDHQINSGSPVFSYTVNVPGDYNYVCIFHQSFGMVGHFTVLGTAGINTAASIPVLSFNKASFQNDELNVSYNIQHNSKIEMRIYDILGKNAGQIFSSYKGEGNYNEHYPLSGLTKGVYFLRLESDGKSLTKKLVIQ